MATRFLVLQMVAMAADAYTTHSYDLEVPGSNPIRIIEAEPVWGSQHTRREDLRGDRIYRADLEHRTLHSTKKPDTITDREDSDYEDNSHKLKDFLNKYADGLRRRRPPLQVHDEGVDELYLKDDLDSDEVDEVRGINHEKKSWNLLHVEKHNHPFDDDKGWVSMEAIPWSMSKIAKWHTRPHNNNNNNNNNDNIDNDRLQNGYYERPEVPNRYQNYGKPNNNKFQTIRIKPRPQRPTPKPVSYYNGQDDDDEPEEEDDYYINPNGNKNKPDYGRPSAIYGHKVQVQSVGHYSSESPKPSWQKRPHKHDNNCKHNTQMDIITDGLPANFPEHSHEYSNNRRRGTSSNTETLPASHPFKGDVLPPLDDGKVNMTTSHGGLLQVESTFQTVEESQKAFAKRQKLKTRIHTRKPAPVRSRPAASLVSSPVPSAVQAQNSYQVPYQINDRDSSPDTASVLAAVGAGMIPASMALLVPMAMSGRKRRDLLRKAGMVTANPYSEQIEITLPRSL